MHDRDRQAGGGRRTRPPRDSESSAEAYSRALKLLSVRARGRVDLARDLERRGFGRDAVESALDRLIREGWLDELAAARSVVRSKAARYGRLRLLRELAVRGFSDEIASAALSDLDRDAQQQSLKKAFDRLWKATRGVPEPQRRARVARALARRGFPGDAISAMIHGSHEVD